MFYAYPPPTENRFAWAIFRGKKARFGAENMPSGATL